MIIECTHCRAKYQYDEERFERKPSKKIRCAKCQEVFEIHNPAFTDAPKPRAGMNDSTVTGRRKTTEELLPIPVETNSSDEGAEPGGPASGKPRLSDSRRYSLAVLSGPDSGKVFHIDKARMILGRSNADIVLNDIETSREHAEVEVYDATVLLHDLGSTNGTLFDGEKISEPVELFNHSEFMIGSTMLMLIVTDTE